MNVHHHHLIFNIRISPSTKFYLELTILIFWTKFAQNGYLQSRAHKMNITVEFCMLELV